MTEERRRTTQESAQAEDQGEKYQYDPTWKGPNSARSCTDTFWLLVIVIFTLSWIYVCVYAHEQGNPRKLLTPTDTESRHCGVDKWVTDKPYLLFFDLTACRHLNSHLHCPTTQVCVKNCPSEDFHFDVYRNGKFSVLLEKLICKIEIHKEEIRDVAQVDRLIKSGKCAEWYLASMPVVKRCVPLKIPNITDVEQILSEEQLMNFIKFVDSVAHFSETLDKIFADVKASTFAIVTVSLTGGCLALLFIIMTKWIAKECIYISIAVVCLFLVVLIFYVNTEYLDAKRNLDLYVLIGLVVTLVAIILMVLLFRKRIDLASRIIEEASKCDNVNSSLFFFNTHYIHNSRAVTDNLATLVFAVLPWVIGLLLTILAIYVFVQLFTAYEPTYYVDLYEGDNCQCPSELNFQNNSACDPQQFYEQCRMNGTEKPCPWSACTLKPTMSGKISYFHLVNFVGYYWLWFFFCAFTDLVLAGTFATWYWTMNKSDVPLMNLPNSIFRVGRYHLGTIAFGSLILTICKIIRILISKVIDQTRRGPGNVTIVIKCCCNCVLYMFEKFFQFMTGNVYIMVAIHGKNFCASAKDGFNLIKRNLLRVVILGEVSWLLLLLAKVVIVALAVLITWCLVQGSVKLNYIWVPELIVGVVTYYIATLFFKVQVNAIDTIFLCFLEDSERNDGSNERPYYMSQNLKNFLLNK